MLALHAGFLLQIGIMETFRLVEALEFTNFRSYTLHAPILCDANNTVGLKAP